jgi:ectoine hydroxylase-related dioxygenase (phytanoyl-CoA dioxygenase family)
MKEDAYIDRGLRDRSAGSRNAEALDRILANIERLGLKDNLIELEALGYTRIDGVLSADQVERAKAAILKRVEGETGNHIDLDTATEADFRNLTYVYYMLYEDEVFEEILMQEKPLALMTYLLGESCVLSSIGSHFKGMGEKGVVPLHSDNGNGIPQPFPPYSLCANMNYALTPYSREAGALAVVPRSHQLCRQPTLPEMTLGGEGTNPDAVSMDLSPGDCVVWHGNTWHGSFPRQIPGIRMNLAVFMARQFVVTQERHKGVVPQEVLDRHANDERFKVLLHGRQPYNWQEEGPDYALQAQAPRGLFD